MNNINKKSLIAIVIAVLAIVTLTGAMALSFVSTSGYAQDGYNLANTSSEVGENIPTLTQGGTIFDAAGLVSALSSGTGEWWLNGNMTLDASSLWGGTTSTIGVLGESFILHGQGKTITLTGATEFYRTDYSSDGRNSSQTFSLISNSFTEGRIIKTAGGLAQINNGLIENVNFVWANSIDYGETITEGGNHDTYWSASYGMIFGINAGTIDNCTLTVNNYTRVNYRMTLAEKNWAGDYNACKYNWDSYHRTACFGGFAGTLMGGTIKNSSLNLKANIVTQQKGRTFGSYRGGNNKLWTGGFCGVINQGGNIYNATTYGTGSIDAYSDPSLSTNGNNAVAASGIIAGCNAVAADSNAQNQSNWTSLGGAGMINGVMNYWTGTARTMNGGAFGAELGPNGNASDFTGQGVICGLAGNYTGNGGVTLKNVYYINMDIPSAICAKNWNSFTQNSVTSTIPTGTASIRTGISTQVTNYDDKGTLKIYFDGTTDTAVPKISYDAPYYSPDAMSFGGAQAIVWSVKYSTPTESNRTLDIYKNVGSVDNVSNFTSWNSENKIPRDLTGDGQSFSFTFEPGVVATYGNPRNPKINNVITDMPIDETYSNIFIATGHEFNGSGLYVPSLKLYSDSAKTKLIGQVQGDESIFKAYKQGAPGQQYNLSEAVDVATWEIYCPAQDTVNNIIFTATNTEKMNVVVFKESSDNLVIRQVTTPKAVTVSYTKAPADFTYNSSPAAFTASASGLVSGYDATPNIEYYKLIEEEGVLTEVDIVDNQAKNAGKYRAKITTLSSNNYVVANPEELSIDFEITPREITVTPLPEELQATNPIFVYDGLEKLPTYSVFGNGVSEGDALIKILNVVDNNVIKVTYEPYATETTNATDDNFINAGTYKMILEKESGNMSNNYSFEKTTFIIEIGRADVTITVSAEEALQDGAVVKEYNSTFQKVKWTITKPENGEEPVLTESYLNKESGVAIANGANRGGEYTVTASIDREAGFNTNYNVAICSVEMKINAKDMTIVWFPGLTEEEIEAKKIVPYISDIYDYGNVNRVGLFQNDAIKPAYAIKGYKYMWKANPEDEYVEVENAFNAGYYVVSPIMTTAPNYNMLNGEFAFQITPIATTIEVTPTSKLYGDFDPTFDWAVAGGYTPLFEDDEVIPSFLASEQYSAPGAYAVTLASVGGAQGGNYVITLVENTALTINKRGVSIEFGVEGAVDNVAIYDGNVKTFTTPVLTYQNEDFVDAEGKMALQYEYFKIDRTVITASDIRNAGKYSVTVQLTEEADKYFTITYGATVNFMIDKMTVTIDTVGKEVTYGDEIGSFSWSYADGSATFVAEDGIVVSTYCNYVLYDKCGSFDILATIADNVNDGVQLAENYNLEFGSVGQLVVNKRGVNVTAITLPVDKTYDGTAKVVQAVYDNTVNGDVLEFIYTFNGQSQAIDKGSYSVNVDLIHDNYYIDQTTSELLVITARKVTLAVDDVNVTYGDDVPTITWQYADGSLQFVEGDGVAVNVLTDYTKYSGVGNYAIFVETTASDNYDVTVPENAKVVVGALAITATLTMPTELVYDGLEKTVEANLNGVLGSDVVDVDIFYNGTTSAIDAGNYVVTVVSTNANYTISVEGTDNFTVAPKTIKFLTNNGEKGYGSDVIVFAEGVAPYEFVEGTIEDRDVDDVTISVACALPIEQQVIGEKTADMIYVVLGGSKASNYIAITETKGSITIVSNSLSNAVLEEESSVYDATDKKTIINVLNVNKDDITVTYKDATDGTVASIIKAGTYKVVVEVKAEAQSKYTGEMTVELPYVVEKRTINIVAVNTELTYGDVKPATFWAYADGSLKMIDSDALAITVTETYSQTSHAGTPINVTYDVEHVNDNYNNYIFNLPQNVQITVAKKTLTFNVDLPTDAVYDKTAKEAGAAISGVVNGDDVTVDVSYTDNVNAGTCGVTLQVGGTKKDNYIWDEYEGSFVIAPKQITVSDVTLPADLVYSATAKVASVVINGVLEGDDAKATALYNGEEEAINAGSYVVTVVANNSNYEIVGNYSKNMTIAPRELTLQEFTYESSYVYDGTAKTVGATLNNIPAEETQADLFSLRFTKEGEDTAQVAINAGVYSVTILLNSDNYTLAEYEAGELTIAKKTLTIVSVAGTNTVYDGNVKVLAVVFDGVVDGEVVEYVLVDEEDNILTPINAGTYTGYVALDANGAVAANYELTRGDLVTLTIDKVAGELNVNDITIIANYNKLTINGVSASNVRYSLDGNYWQESNVFNAKPNSPYTVYVKLVADDNHNESDPVSKNVKTGGDPTVINAKLDAIGEFGFDDIAALKEIEELLKGIAKVDENVIDNSKLGNVRNAYDTLISDAKSVVNEAQNVAGKAAGREVGAAAAASMALSLGAIALAIVKKKMLA
ncbi:MAG: MBG domain-containing protein [Christensenellales bacterium]